jgi:DNA-binding HxlR family transcriptional regulator
VNRVKKDSFRGEDFPLLPEKKYGPTIPQLAYQADPIRETLRLLGRKWTLLIIRDIAFLKLERFGQILKNNPGLTPRILSRRLEQMTKEGLVTKIRDGRAGELKSRYHLTTKGEDAVYILLAILRYGIRHCMGKKSEGETEQQVIKDLQYAVPRDWSY